MPSGKVIDLGYFGKDSLYRVKLASGAWSASTVSMTSAPAKPSGSPWEDEVWLSFEPFGASC